MYGTHKLIVGISQKSSLVKKCKLSPDIPPYNQLGQDFNLGLLICGTSNVPYNSIRLLKYIPTVEYYAEM